MLDYAKVKIKAGNGGKGLVSFRREKYVPKGGPNGGDGGHGGNVVLVASNDVSTLLDFQYLDHMEAQSGEAGGTSNKKGKEGQDLIIKVPVGSIVKINKLLVDIPHRKRKKSNQEEPIEYEQKMFNYKKMLKLKLRVETANLEKEEESETEEDVQIPDATLEDVEALQAEEGFSEEVVEVGQSTSENEEDDDAGIVRSEDKESRQEGHKLYKFSEDNRRSDRALLAQKNVQAKYFNEGIPTFDLNVEGEKIILARGGAGGRGNARFKWSQNQAPQFAEPGQRGEYVEIEIILKMVANVGIIGYPNAGKSTILSKLTAASPKVANYPFTTLEPNLGVMTLDSADAPTQAQRLVLADIPGLIEGASQGKGLGFKFLQHVERTQILLHVIEIPDLAEVESATQLTDSVLQSYHTIRSELQQYGNELPDKTEIIVVNKIDKIPDTMRKEYIEPLEQALKTLGRPLVFVSAEQGIGLNGLKKVIEDTLATYTEQ